MPMAEPNVQANRGPVQFSEEEIVALVAYVGAFGDGPAVPDIDIATGDVGAGGEIYRLNCAACHTASLAGAAIGGGRAAPSLMESTPTRDRRGDPRSGQAPCRCSASSSDQDRNDVAAYIVEPPGAQPRGRLPRLRRRRAGRRRAGRLAAGAAAAGRADPLDRLGPRRSRRRRQPARRRAGEAVT